ncbi:leucine-rich repeat and fibronectin type-III domain-containing protein 5-like [Asterias rubens]|uniref:leucine-rich repeat and fibronectin type-III domain-containing protein 5-like n=1 Tax=Asterias rubens TaxID=7604 RepID=UPI001454F768|nr:leucine-rich repeat and fibronectin type-III domain-containing protein 5-like [Asterias rubens]
MKRMDMSNNSFDSLIQPPWAEGLEFLNADTNLLANLSSTTLSGFVDLTELHVANNRLLFISSTALSQLTMLRSLYLDDNALTSLFGVFFNQSILFELSITNNQLTTLHADYFMGLLSLKRLYLAGNQLTSVNMLMFQLVPEIINLDLSQNELQLVDLQDCALINLTNLQYLSLAHNLIHDAETILGFCDNLQVLDMSSNLIQVVPGDSLSGRNKELSHLELEGNPLQCDCRLTGLRNWLRNNPPYVEPRCEVPKQHYGAVITDLGISNFSCQPPLTMTDNDDVTVVSGQSATLECTATGIPVPTVTWLSPNGTEIPHDWQGRFSILQGRILLITPLELADQGVYTCGLKTCSVRLTQLW